MRGWGSSEQRQEGKEDREKEKSENLRKGRNKEGPRHRQVRS